MSCATCGRPGWHPDCAAQRVADFHGGGKVAVELTVMQWAEVAGLLKSHLQTPGEPKASRADWLAALLEIDRVLRGAEERAAPDDLLGGA